MHSARRQAPSHARILFLSSHWKRRGRPAPVLYLRKLTTAHRRGESHIIAYNRTPICRGSCSGADLLSTKVGPLLRLPSRADWLDHRGRSHVPRWLAGLSFKACERSATIPSTPVGMKGNRRRGGPRPSCDDSPPSRSAAKGAIPTGSERQPQVVTGCYMEFRRGNETLEASFPMYVLPVEAVLSLQRLHAHEEVRHQLVPWR